MVPHRPKESAVLSLVLGLLILPVLHAPVQSHLVSTS